MQISSNLIGALSNSDSFNAPDLYKTMTLSFFEALEMPMNERLEMLEEIASAVNDLINSIQSSNDNAGERSQTE